MNFSDSHFEGNKPLDKLERDTLPPSLEAAQAEYFADMAFDDRLLRLLEKHPASTSIAITNVTPGCTDELSLRYFYPNTTIEESHEIFFENDESEPVLDVVDAYAYRLNGTVRADDDALFIDATITSEVGDYPSVQIQSDTTQADRYYISKIGDEFDMDVLDSKELFTLLCQLNGASKLYIDKYMSTLDDFMDTPAVHQKNIQKLWVQLGETHGKSQTVHEITHEIKDPSAPSDPEKIKLRYEETESPEVTIVKLFLEHSKEMVELDTQESHYLALTFQQVNERTIEKVAERIIVSGITPQLIGINFEKKSQGRITPLDITDVNVKQLFVNWFDEVISA